MIMQLDPGDCDIGIHTPAIHGISCDRNKAKNASSSNLTINSANSNVFKDVKYMIEHNFDADDHSEMADKSKQQSKNEHRQGANELFGLTCPFCDVIFSDFETRHLHLVDYHRLKAAFKCVLSHCSTIFDDLDSYVEHSISHRQRAFICNLCNAHVASMSMLLAHKAVAHRKVAANDNRCSLCKVLLNDPKELEDHQIMGDLVHFPCDMCCRVLRSHEDLDTHKRVHASIKPFLCEQCGVGFSNKLALRRHCMTHNDQRPHKCSECEMTFNKREHLLRHMISKHSDLKPFTCDKCSKSFKRRDKLFEHQRTHATKKPFVCSMCGTGYRYREGLKYHVKTHAREKKYVCSECSIPFPRPGQLKKHLRDTHNIKTREQHMYPCSTCAMTFSRPERVRRHMERVHKSSITWQAVCGICKKGFPGEKSLNTHLKKVHTGSNVAKRNTKPAVALTVTPQPEPHITAPVATITTEQLSGTPVNEVQSLYKVIKDLDATSINQTSTIAGQPTTADNNLTTLSNMVSCVDNEKALQLANAQSTAGGSHMVVSKASAIVDGSTDPTAVFMYVHSPVKPENEAVKQPVVAQSQTNIEVPLQESQLNTINVNIMDIMNGTQSIVDNSQVATISYFPSYDQPTAVDSSVSAVTSTQYTVESSASAIDNHQLRITSPNSNQDVMLSQQHRPQQLKRRQVTHHQPILPKQAQTLFPSQTTELVDTQSNVAQVPHRISLPQDSSATQQLLQLISLEALHSSATPGSILSAQGNGTSLHNQTAVKPGGLQTGPVRISSMPTVSSSIQNIGTLQPNVPSTVSTNHLSTDHTQTILEIVQNRNAQTLLHNSSPLIPQQAQPGQSNIMQLLANVPPSATTTTQMSTSNLQTTPSPLVSITLPSNGQLSMRRLLPSRATPYITGQGNDFNNRI